MFLSIIRVFQPPLATCLIILSPLVIRFLFPAFMVSWRLPYLQDLRTFPLNQRNISAAPCCSEHWCPHKHIPVSWWSRHTLQILLTHTHTASPLTSTSLYALRVMLCGLTEPLGVCSCLFLYSSDPNVNMRLQNTPAFMPAFIMSTFRGRKTIWWSRPGTNCLIIVFVLFVFCLFLWKENTKLCL